MLGSVLRHARLLCGPLQRREVRLDGVMRGSDRALAVRYSGSADSLPFVSKMLFATCSQRQDTSAIEQKTADLTIIERPPLWSLLTRSPATLAIPAWVAQAIDLSDMPAGGGSVLPRKLSREVARVVRRCGFQGEFSRDAAAKREFYHRLYQPHVSLRFGDGAVKVSEDYFATHTRDYELAKLLHGDQWIAGVLFRLEGSTLRFSWYGADLPPGVSGASEALDALVIEKAAAEGARTVIFGHSRPSLADGVVRYKQRFGARIRPTRFPQAVISFYVSHWSNALADCLNAAQLIGVRRSAPFLHTVTCRDGVFTLEEESLEPRQNAA